MKVFDLINPKTNDYYIVHMGYLTRSDAEWAKHVLEVDCGASVELVASERAGITYYDRKGQPRMYTNFCTCGEGIITTSGMCDDCFSKALDEFSNEFDDTYGSGRNL